jgi:hypothetical protein
MITLAATNHSLEVLLGATASTQLPVVASVGETDGVSETGYERGVHYVVTNNTTAVAVVSAPASGETRDIDFVSIYNPNTDAVAVTFRLNVGGTTYIQVKVTLLANETLTYSHAIGWRVLDANGQTK